MQRALIRALDAASRSVREADCDPVGSSSYSRSAMPESRPTDYLSEPPDSAGKVMPLARSGPQLLDFLQLGWDNFERLCKRLLEANAGIEHSALYGTRGQNQKGIDVYARPRSG